MAERPTWYELLKHPNWQKRRLEVLERAGWECENCGSKDRTLHVHHAYYEKGLRPWEYPVESLHCLCDPCHKSAQNMRTILERQIGRLTLSDQDELLGYGIGLEAFNIPWAPLDVLTYEVAMGIGRYWELKAETIIEALQDGKIDGYTLNRLAVAAGKRDRPLPDQSDAEA